MTWRGADTLAVNDVISGFIVIGLLCAASFFSFMRLPPGAGAHLNRNKATANDNK